MLPSLTFGGLSSGLHSLDTGMTNDIRWRQQDCHGATVHLLLAAKKTHSGACWEHIYLLHYDSSGQNFLCFLNLAKPGTRCYQRWLQPLTLNKVSEGRGLPWRVTFTTYSSEKR